MSLVDQLAGVFRSGQASQVFGPANANAEAQGSADGIGIQNVRRGLLRVALTGLGGNVTVSSTTFASLSTVLSGDMVLSGRPLRVAVAGVAAAGSGGALAIDVLLRGASITGVSNGIAYTGSTNDLGFHGEEVVMAPGPGRATLEVVARRATADGTIYTTGTANRLVLIAEEK